jgi:hypothetical protein
MTNAKDIQEVAFELLQSIETISDTEFNSYFVSFDEIILLTNDPSNFSNTEALDRTTNLEESEWLRIMAKNSSYKNQIIKAFDEQFIDDQDLINYNYTFDIRDNDGFKNMHIGKLWFKSDERLFTWKIELIKLTDQFKFYSIRNIREEG